jgi:ubiquinone/menaquinone biosynthesis C-methylase UbiE
MSRFRRRAMIPELMDDLSRPRGEFDEAYRDLARVNRWLGGVRAIERFLPAGNLLILDVAAGACDVGESISSPERRVVVLDRNPEGLKLAKRSSAVTADALEMPFPNGTFDIVMASLFFHHLSDEDCVRVLKSMWRIARRLVVVNDLHRHPIAYFSIRTLAAFSRSVMFRHDAPVSVLRAFTAKELLAIARHAGIAARVHRSFPYRLVLVADKCESTT